MRNPSCRYPHRRFIALTLIIIGFALSLTARAAVDSSLTTDDRAEATVELSDGSVIIGRVIDIAEDTLHLATAFSDDLAIDLALVRNFRWFQETELLLDDHRVVDINHIEVTDGELVLGDERLKLEAIDLMNPEDWETGKGYQWSGDTSAALAYTRGNTQTDEFDVVINTVFTSVDDRYTLNSRFEQDHTYSPITQPDGTEGREKVATADNWKILGKYDYFLDNPRNYLGINVSVEADALAGIDHRSYAGPYAGRRLIQRSGLTLDGELGLALVNTVYDASVDQSDNNYTGLNWNLTGSSDVLGRESKIYLRHVGILDLQASDQVIVKNTLGVSFPLFLGLQGSAELSYDYDGTAAADRDEIDQAYRFRVGYTW